MIGNKYAVAYRRPTKHQCANCGKRLLNRNRHKQTPPFFCLHCWPKRKLLCPKRCEMMTCKCAEKKPNSICLICPKHDCNLFPKPCAVRKRFQTEGVCRERPFMYKTDSSNETPHPERLKVIGYSHAGTMPPTNLTKDTGEPK